jgi:hypothetical protein
MVSIAVLVPNCRERRLVFVKNHDAYSPMRRHRGGARVQVEAMAELSAAPGVADPRQIPCAA